MKNEKRPQSVEEEVPVKRSQPAEEEKIISAWEAVNIDISEKCIEILAGERIRPDKVSRIDRLFELVPTIPVGDRPSLMDHFPNLSYPGTARRCDRRHEAVLSCRVSKEVAHLYVLLGPLDEAVWRVKKPQIYKGLSELGFPRIFLQPHQSPAGILLYLPEEDWVGAQRVTRFLGDCSLGVFRVGDPDKFRLCLVDHGSRPRRKIDFDRHPN
ncbi:hypothetical protein PAPYR_12267 [Paratrimastix pyriformis]|uniref:Uncharacterized protein n=1 Tax=Paratrimastix pyriformis TaxID=342808 RepID=A0ABQ8U4Q2_9EUKA|nr:hypothetical protein PAPYR_12267 [Paratrimastix pyriformis]